MKSTIDIEDLLVWAYRTELPKEPVEARTMALELAKGWDSVSSYGRHLAVIDGPDVRNLFGVTPDRSALVGPHADALAVAHAVEGLAGLTLDVPADWWPFGDMATVEEWGLLGEAVVANALDRMSAVGEDGVRRFKCSAAWLVQKHAMMGTTPVWEAETTVLQWVRERGKPKWFVRRLVPQMVHGEIIGTIEVEGDGYCPKAKRPMTGAYQRQELSPSPFGTACDRAEHEVWHAALTLLADELSESLTTKCVTGPRCPARPWLADAPQSRILPSLLKIRTGAS